jgi:hypothetical protein
MVRWCAPTSTPPVPDTSPPRPIGGAPQYPDEALGRSRGGLSTKLHLRTEGGGKPIAIVLTAGVTDTDDTFAWKPPPRSQP